MTVSLLPRSARGGRRLLGAAVLVCSLLFPSLLQAQDADDVPVVTRAYAITNARVVPAPGEAIEGATIVVRNGLIEAVGRNVNVPYDAQVIAGDSLTVYAGFIDGLSHTGVETPNMDMDVEVERPGDPPPARAGIQPDRSVRPMLTPSDVAKLRAVGFTTAHVVPEGQMLPGTGAIIQLAGETGDAMVLRDGASLFMQMEPSRFSWPNVIYPNTPMAVLAKMRDLVRESTRRLDMADAYAENPRGRERPPTDPIHDAFAPVVRGEQPVAVYTEDVLDLHRVLGLQRELGFSMILTGLNGSFEALDALSTVEAPLFLTLDLPEPPKDAEAESDSTEADPDTPITPEAPGSFFQSDVRVRSYEDVEAEAAELKKRQAQQRLDYYRTAALFREAGLSFGFATKDVKAGDVRENLRTMIENGLSEDDALRALTVDAATLLGLEDQMGTVESGKIANLVLTDGNYFAEDTSIQTVFVDGMPFEIDTGEDAGEVTGEVAAVVGTWEYSVDTPQGKNTGTLELEASGSGLEGTISSADGSETNDLRSVSFDGTTLSFEFDGGQVGSISVTVTVEGETFEGSATAGPYGSFPMTGERTSSPE